MSTSIGQFHINYFHANCPPTLIGCGAILLWANEWMTSRRCDFIHTRVYNPHTPKWWRNNESWQLESCKLWNIAGVGTRVAPNPRRSQAWEGPPPTTPHATIKGGKHPTFFGRCIGFLVLMQKMHVVNSLYFWGNYEESGHKHKLDVLINLH